MTQENRQHRRIKKRITVKFFPSGVLPRKCDMSVVDNISVGGVKFRASAELFVNTKIVQLQIRIPQLSPVYINVQALVLAVKPCFNGKVVEVRAKFINLTKEDQEHLSIIDKMIDQQEARALKESQKRKKVLKKF